MRRRSCGETSGWQKTPREDNKKRRGRNHEDGAVTSRRCRHKSDRTKTGRHDHGEGAGRRKARSSGPPGCDEPPPSLLLRATVAPTAEAKPVAQPEPADLAELAEATEPTEATEATDSVDQPAPRLLRVVPDLADDWEDLEPAPTSATRARPRAAALLDLLGVLAGDGERIEDAVGALVNVLRVAAETAGLDTDEAEALIARTLAYLRRRACGDYTVDEFGFDEDFTNNVWLPLLRPIYEKWFRVEVRGVENIPPTGAGLIVANHSGTIPVDGMMTQVAVHESVGRHLKLLGADLVFELPFVGTNARRAGSTLATAADAERLLDHGEFAPSIPGASRGSASRSPSATSCSGSAAAGSSRPRCAPACRSSRARSSGPRRSIPSSATSPRSPGCSARRTSRSPRSSRCSGRSASSRCRASGSSPSVSRSTPPRSSGRCR